MKISKRAYRQIKNLEKICTFDIENKVAYVPLHYDTPEDLLDIHVSWPDAPVISDDAIDYIQEIISSVPDMFSVEISLTVDDCGIYTYEQLIDALRATIENTYYYHDEKKRNNNVLAVFFIIVGFLALSIEVIGGMAGWFGEKGTMMRSFIETVADVITWVFLWEGCALLFLTYENESTVFGEDMQRFHKVSFRNRDGKLLVSMDKNQFYESWVKVGKREEFSRCFVLLSDVIFLASLIIQIVMFIAAEPAATGISVLLNAVNWVLTLLLVISNVSFYLDKGKLGKYAFAFSVAAFVYNVLDVVLYTSHFLNDTAGFIFGCIFIVGLLVNSICIAYLKKQKIEI
ncbi:MAG: hypothetical protein Q4E54_00380 [Lachnospiraceae bacterium]|nr:hypothetical protein [Lachnospiraceae bacterium]